MAGPPPVSLAAREADLLDQLRVVDPIRPDMEDLASDLETECIVVAGYADSLVFLASSGERRGTGMLTRIGHRIPFAAPVGAALFAADPDSPLVDEWLHRVDLPADHALTAVLRQLPRRTRDDGVVIGTGAEEFEQLERHIAEQPAREKSAS